MTINTLSISKTIFREPVARYGQVSVFDQSEGLMRRELMRSVESIQAELDDQYGELFSFALRVVVENRTHADRWRDKENETGVVLY